MPPQPLTLIVATTPIPRLQTPTAAENALVQHTRLGIGLKGTLPWPRIKTDMSFFARVTARPPPPPPPPPHPAHGAIRPTNAIVMGRKTYDSVPGKLRPLGKRVSVVVTRDVSGQVGERVLGELRGKLAPQDKALAGVMGASGTGAEGKKATEGQTDAFVAGGLEEALETLDTRDTTQGARRNVGKVFVIGGAEIYGAALRLKKGERKVRIVMTKVERRDGGVFECDTFFPVDEELVHERGWRKVSARELTEWVGEEVSGEWIEEGEVRVQMVGYERVD
ncbi:hypothetical protein ARAM_006695 [Aspergillus rambellii]|uniref:Dihydrofolate reductase n=1 Tax=Aspergillus rambellii TaxID=308745 RepID=A0A0F8WZ20_9EURO|nr:hypothetical protein ARAM_006695 [Aspergillus rambellii]